MVPAPGDESFQTADHSKVLAILPPISDNTAFQQNGGSQSASACQSLHGTIVGIQAADPNSAVARRRRDQRRFRTKEKVQVKPVGSYLQN